MPTLSLSAPLVIQLAVFIGVSILCYFVACIGCRDEARFAVRMRRAGLENDAAPTGNFARRIKGLMVLLEPQVAWFLPNDAESRTRLQARLFRAGIYRPGGLLAFTSIKVVLTATPPVVGLILAVCGVLRPQHALVSGGALGILGWAAAEIGLYRTAAARQRTLRKSLPDFLDLLTICVEGGMTLQAAMAEVTDELLVAHRTLAGEFNIARREMQMGRNMETAFQNLADRCDLEELRSLATFVKQSQRFGSTIAEALRQMSDMLRVHREHRAEEAAQKAAVKILIPTLLFIFPTVFVVLAGPAAIQIHQSFTHPKQVTLPPMRTTR